MDDSIDKPIKGLGFRVLRGAMLSIIAIIGLVVTSALLEGWLFFGISFQQTTVGHVLWPIALFLLNLVHPMTLHYDSYALHRVANESPLSQSEQG